MNLDECYRLLELKPGASLREARAAYYKLLKFFHPDRHQHSPGLLRKATEETKKLNLAYEQICKAFRPRQSGRATWNDAGTKGRTRREKGGSSTGTAPVPGESYVVPCCGMKLNWIASGSFVMGSPPDEAGRSNDEGPQAAVTISRGFWMGISAVTQEEWKLIVEEGSDELRLKAEPSFFRGARLPVEQVSWNECQDWLRKLNALEESALRGLKGYEYRLPTEAEWEFTCRSGSTTRFYFGNVEVGDAGKSLRDSAWYSANSGGQTHSVGEKKPNAWGLSDMHGNVWEWCQDWYGPLKGGQCMDPSGPILGMKRVMRGGSWGVAAERCRAAYRVWNEVGYRDYTVGFRVVLAPSILAR